MELAGWLVGWLISYLVVHVFIQSGFFYFGAVCAVRYTLALDIQSTGHSRLSMHGLSVQDLIVTNNEG